MQFYTLEDPFPLAYNALGDIFVLIFYGFIAVEVTHYILLLNQAVQYSPNYFAGLSVGCMTNLLLVTNNYRDYQEDEKNEKKTLIVVFGRKFGFYFYLSCLFAASVCAQFSTLHFDNYFLLTLWNYCPL